MDVAVLFFLSSGLFLGWSLGANDAANVFGTAVGTRMVRFATDLPLYRKAHLRNFVEHIDNVADRSEDVADRLAIYTIKRRF